MIRIGILGSENSHAEAFTKIFNENKGTENDLFPDIKVVAIGGHYEESNRRLYSQYNLDFIAEKPQEMLGKVDAVMVTSRDGKYHFDFAMPFVEKGIPAFIDKPFSDDPQQALDIVTAAKKKNVPLYGGSTVKLADDVIELKKARQKEEVCGGSVAAPLSMVNEYGGFFFYSSHLAEVSLSIFGYNPVAVTAFEKKNHVTAVVDYEDYQVSNHFTNDFPYSYFAAVFGKSGNTIKNIDISKCYLYACEGFVKMLKTGKSDMGYLELIAPVYYLKAIEDSFRSGQKQKIIIPEI